MTAPDPSAPDPRSQTDSTPADADEWANATVLACPGCGEEIEVTAYQTGRTRCPYCSAEFSLSDTDDLGTADQDAAEREAAVRRRQDELDDVRVRQVLTLRRGLFRQRSYCLIGAGALLVLAGQLGWMTYTRVRAAGWQPRPVGYVLIAVVALSCATVLLRFARGFARELATSTMPEPTTPPDFSTLSDGSQRAENLNHVR